VSLIGRRRIGMLALGLAPACATYSSLEGELQGDVTAQAGIGATSSGGTEGGSGQGGSSAAAAAGASGSTSGAASSGGTTSAGSGGDAGGGGEPNVPAVRPTALTLSEATTNVAREPDAGGTEYLERCPENEVLIGFHGTVDAPDAPDGETYLRSAQAICGSLSIGETEPWAITVTETQPLLMHEIASTEVQTARCPANQVMVGFAGRSGLWMDSVDVRCAPLTILGVSPSFLLVAGTASKAATIGGATGGSPFDPLECAAGSVAVGQLIRTIHSGVVLGAFGVQCAAITLETE
jgi:hypothetical protein